VTDWLFSYFLLYLCDRLLISVKLCLIAASLFSVFRIIQFVCNIFKYHRMKCFFESALKITKVSVKLCIWTLFTWVKLNFLNSFFVTRLHLFTSLSNRTGCIVRNAYDFHDLSWSFKLWDVLRPVCSQLSNNMKKVLKLLIKYDINNVFIITMNYFSFSLVSYQ